MKPHNLPFVCIQLHEGWASTNISAASSLASSFRQSEDIWAFVVWSGMTSTFAVIHWRTIPQIARFKAEWGSCRLDLTNSVLLFWILEPSQDSATHNTESCSVYGHFSFLTCGELHLQHDDDNLNCTAGADNFCCNSQGWLPLHNTRRVAVLCTLSDCFSIPNEKWDDEQNERSIVVLKRVLSPLRLGRHPLTKDSRNSSRPRVNDWV